MTVTTSETQAGQVTLVTMAPAAGQGMPSQINLSDGSVLHPNGAATISVDAKFVSKLMRAGFGLVVSGSNTVP